MIYNQNKKRGEVITVNRELRIAMTKAGIATLSELSIRTGLSYPTIYNMAWGKTIPTIDTMKKVADILDESIDNVLLMIKSE